MLTPAFLDAGGWWVSPIVKRTEQIAAIAADLHSLRKRQGLL